MKIVTVFPLLKAFGVYIISKVYGVAQIGGRRIKEGGLYFKISEIIHMKLRKIFIFSFQITVCNYNNNI